MNLYIISMKFYSIRFTTKYSMNQLQKAIFPINKGTEDTHCNSHKVNISFHEQMFTKKLLKTILFLQKKIVLRS